MWCGVCVFMCVCSVFGPPGRELGAEVSSALNAGSSPNHWAILLAWDHSCVAFYLCPWYRTFLSCQNSHIFFKSEASVFLNSRAQRRFSLGTVRNTLHGSGKHQNLLFAFNHFKYSRPQLWSANGETRFIPMLGAMCWGNNAEMISAKCLGIYFNRSGKKWVQTDNCNFI